MRSLIGKDGVVVDLVGGQVLNLGPSTSMGERAWPVVVSLALEYALNTGATAAWIISHTLSAGVDMASWALWETDTNAAIGVATMEG